MIRFPNSFEGLNLTARVIAEHPIDFSVFYKDYRQLPKDILTYIKTVTDFYITFSNMTSSINEDENIEYKEVIIKVPVVYKGDNYIFPVISFVSNELSLIRGFYMGFNKELSTSCFFDEKKVQLDFKDFLHLRIDYFIEDETNEAMAKILKYPFLLIRNFDIGMKRNDIVTLKVANYKKANCCSANCTSRKIGIINNINIYSDDIIISKDNFDITGINSIMNLA